MSTPASSSSFGQFVYSQYWTPRRMLAALAEDFTEEQARERVGDLKPLVWYLGHIAVTENYLLSLYGGAESAVSKEHLQRYGRGSDGHADFSDASKAEMLELLETLRTRMKELLTSLAVEDAEREAPGEVGHPLFAKLGSAISLINAHNAYHAGQIGVLRRAMGKDPLFG